MDRLTIKSIAVRLEPRQNRFIIGQMSHCTGTDIW
jgi:hypothetical protein